MLNGLRKKSVVGAAHAIGCLLLLAACEPRNDASGGEIAAAAGTGSAGADCLRASDCGVGHQCIAHYCRPTKTSREGEILAVGARNQMTAGDLDGALATFSLAREAFDRLGAPLPADIACNAALVALRLADDEASRERAAGEADRCFRLSAPGDSLREEVQRLVAMLRFDGIDLSLFDAPTPAEAFFVEEPTRPTADAIRITMDLPASDGPGFAELRDALLGEGARIAISNCFVKDWETQHERSVSAALVLGFRNRLEDMGDYDVFSPDVSISAATDPAPPFAACLTDELTQALQPGPRVGRTVTAWQEAFEIEASVP